MIQLTALLHYDRSWLKQKKVVLRRFFLDDRSWKKRQVFCLQTFTFMMTGTGGKNRHCQCDKYISCVTSVQCIFSLCLPSVAERHLLNVSHSVTVMIKIDDDGKLLKAPAKFLNSDICLENVSWVTKVIIFDMNGWIEIEGSTYDKLIRNILCWNVHEKPTTQYLHIFHVQRKCPGFSARQVHHVKNI